MPVVMAAVLAVAVVHHQGSVFVLGELRGRRSRRRRRKRIEAPRGIHDWILRACLAPSGVAL